MTVMAVCVRVRMRQQVRRLKNTEDILHRYVKCFKCFLLFAVIVIVLLCVIIIVMADKFPAAVAPSKQDETD